MVKAMWNHDNCSVMLIMITIRELTMHNVLFGQYVSLPTEQGETYLKIYILICHSTYIYPSLIGWKKI